MSHKRRFISSSEDEDDTSVRSVTPMPDESVSPFPDMEHPTRRPPTPILQPSTPTLPPPTPILRPSTPTLPPPTPILPPPTPILRPSTPTLQPSTPIAEPPLTKTTPTTSNHASDSHGKSRKERSRCHTANPNAHRPAACTGVIPVLKLTPVVTPKLKSVVVKPTSPVRPVRHFPSSLISEKVRKDILDARGPPSNRACPLCHGKLYPTRDGLRDHIRTHFVRFFCECGYCTLTRDSISRHQRIKEKANDPRPHKAICEVSVDQVAEFQKKQWPLKNYVIPRRHHQRPPTNLPPTKVPRPKSPPATSGPTIAATTSAPPKLPASTCCGDASHPQRIRALEERVSRLEDIIGRMRDAVAERN